MFKPSQVKLQQRVEYFLCQSENIQANGRTGRECRYHTETQGLDTEASKIAITASTLNMTCTLRTYQCSHRTPRNFARHEKQASGMASSRLPSGVAPGPQGENRLSQILKFQWHATDVATPCQVDHSARVQQPRSRGEGQEMKFKP